MYLVFAVFWPVVDDQSVCFVAVQPRALDEYFDEHVGVTFPPDRLCDRAVRKGADITSWGVLPGELPEDIH